MRRQAPRLLIAGTGSGCGKTTAVCAILQALVNRGADVGAFKCGPDYIDPMFHSQIIGAESGNIDLFFAGEELARSLFLRHAKELNVIEGVMGYYDGLSMESVQASSWHAARTLAAPALLVVNGQGMAALSVSAVIRGFQTLRAPGGISGVLLNRVSPMTYPKMKEVIEAECGVKVYGYLPQMPGAALESRHLGLVTAPEVEGLRQKLAALADQAEKSVELDALIALMQSAPALQGEDCAAEKLGDVRIAVARDRAFCFYYRDNLELLEALGAELVPFSPLRDETLPPCDGLYLGGGYPELHREALSRNERMRESVRRAVTDGLPTIAECGGFMYLTGAIGGAPMAGALPGDCADRGRLTRFGYVTLRAEQDSLLLKAGEEIRAHEFHYWDAEDPGASLEAVKPTGKSWRCAHVSDTLYAGFPHLYFPSRPEAAGRFIEKCLERKNAR